MKKNYLMLFFLLMAGQFLQAQSTETFETDTPGATTFTDAGQVFEVSSWQPFGIASNAGSGWNGTSSDNVFIDNHLSAMPGQECLLTIKSQNGTPFTLKSLWVYMSYMNATGPKTLTFFGILSGSQKFSTTQAINWDSQPMATEGAYKLIDFSTWGGKNTADILIDQFVVITTSGYLAIDAITWQCEAPAITSSIQNNVTCEGANDGSATVFAEGDDLIYDWAPGNPAGDGTSTVTGLAAGIYTCTVRKPCSAPVTLSFTITEPDALSVTLSHTDPVCYNTSTGTAVAEVTGGTAPYTYLWSNGITDADITGLAAGEYSVTVTDFAGCSTIQTVTILENQPLSASFAITHNYCYGSSDGSAITTVTGGSGNYTFEWSDGTTGPNLEYAVAGTYTLTITDSLGCGSITETIVINEPETGMTGYVVALPVQCYGGTTTGTAVVSGGTPPYTYHWPNGDTNQNTTNIPSGFHNVFITDANGCDLIATYFLSQPTVTPLVAEAQVISNAICNAGNDGVAQVNVTGGTAPYMYSWSPAGGNSMMATNLAAGDYTVTITDAKGCTAETSVIIIQPAAMLAAVVATDATCDGSGSAMVNVSGGTAPFSYLWSNGSTETAVSGLASGMHNVTVTDANGCTAYSEFAVNAPAALEGQIFVTAATCHGEATGSAEIVMSGENGPYTYLWSNGATTSGVSNLAAGEYTVTVTAASGCSVDYNTDVSQPDEIVLNVAVDDPACAGDTGMAWLTIDGYSGIVNVLWPDGSTGDGATGLVPGNYIVTITTAEGCTITKAFTVSEAPLPLTTNIVFNNVSCYGGTTEVAIEVSGATEPYSYYWTDGTDLLGTNESIILSAGNYTVVVTDAHGCVTEEHFTILQPEAAISATVESTGTLTCFAGNDGIAMATATGGTAPYSYAWSSGATTATATGLSAGTYTVSITDINGCTATAIVTLTAPAAISNDECSGAQHIATGVSLPNNLCATQSAVSLPSCTASAYDSWYSFNSGSVSSYRLDINMGYAVYSGTCNALTQIVCSTGGVTAFSVEPNTVYYIRAFASSLAGRGEFTINLDISCTAPTALQVFNDAANIIANWAAPATVPASGYQYEIRTSGAAGSGVTGLVQTGNVSGTSASFSGLSLNSSYILYLRSNCGSGTFSSWTAGVPFSTGYCTPAPAAANGIIITNVKFDTVNNTTGGETGNYANYTALTGTGHRANITTVNVTTPAASFVKIWVDWNNDYDFNDSGEEVYAAVTAQNYTTAAFTIPSGVLTGNHRMRVGSASISSFSPCYGAEASFEDYTLFVNPLGPVHLNNNVCNSIISSFNRGLYTNNFSGAQQYRFRVKLGTSEQIILRSQPYITLSMLTAPSYGVTYLIDVAAMIDGTWTDYGKVCSVTTSDMVSSLEDCYEEGFAVESFTKPVYATYVPTATNYRFMIATPGGDIIIDRPNRYFTINMIPGYDYNVDYHVKVAIMLNGAWSDFGETCTVRVDIPSVTVRSQYCNATVAKKTTVIYANNVPNAVTWHFRVTVGASQYVVVKNVGYFMLNNVPATINPGQTVGVEVKVFSAGAESAWGAMCNVTLASATGRPGNTNADEPKTSLKGFPNPFTETFALDFDTESQEMVNIMIYDIAGKLVEQRKATVNEIPTLRFGDNFAAGVYNLVLTQGKTVKTVRVVKDVN